MLTKALLKGSIHIPVTDVTAGVSPLTHGSGRKEEAFILFNFLIGFLGV